jgi:hypothetical protein
VLCPDTSIILAAGTIGWLSCYSAHDILRCETHYTVPPTPSPVAPRVCDPQVTMRNVSKEYAARCGSSDLSVTVDACLQVTVFTDDGSKLQRSPRETFRWAGSWI